MSNLARLKKGGGLAPHPWAVGQLSGQSLKLGLGYGCVWGGAGGAGAHRGGEPGVPGAQCHVPDPPDAFRTRTRRLTTYHHLSPLFCGWVCGGWGGGVVAGGAGRTAVVSRGSRVWSLGVGRWSALARWFLDGRKV